MCNGYLPPKRVDGKKVILGEQNAWKSREILRSTETETLPAPTGNILNVIRLCSTLCSSEKISTTKGVSDFGAFDFTLFGALVTFCLL